MVRFTASCDASRVSECTWWCDGSGCEWMSDFWALMGKRDGDAILRSGNRQPLSLAWNTRLDAHEAFNVTDHVETFSHGWMLLLTVRWCALCSGTVCDLQRVLFNVCYEKGVVKWLSSSMTAERLRLKELRCFCRSGA